VLLVVADFLAKKVNLVGPDRLDLMDFRVKKVKRVVPVPAATSRREFLVLLGQKAIVGSQDLMDILDHLVLVVLRLRKVLVFLARAQDVMAGPELMDLLDRLVPKVTPVLSSLFRRSLFMERMEFLDFLDRKAIKVTWYIQDTLSIRIKVNTMARIWTTDEF
jgi:hypothetical protein